MNTIISSLIILFSVMFAVPNSRAQDNAQAYFTAEQGTPLVGEPISLLLTVDVPAGAVITMPQFSSTWPPFTVLEVGEVTLDSRGGRDVYQQMLTVTVWATGDFQTPTMTIEYQEAGVLRHVQVQPATFTVPSVLDPDDLNLRPLKPPVSMFYLSPWLVVGLLGGVSAAIFYVWRMRVRWLSAWAVTAKPDNIHASARAALDGLKQLRERKLSPIKAYAIAGNMLRGYVQGRFAVPAEEMTTEELVVRLAHGEDLTERRQRELVYLLEQADLVKFAQLQPQPKSAKKMVDVAQRWILAVEQDHRKEVG